MTDAAGVATFTVADGSPVKLRYTSNGTYVWSSVVTSPATCEFVVPADTVVTVTKGGAPLANLAVYAFNAAGTYLGISRTTDAAGQAVFTLVEGQEVKFRVTDTGIYHWSALTVAPVPAGLNVPSDTTVTVTKGGVALGNVTVYAFTDAGVYTGYSRQTDALGVARFALAAGSSFKFRVSDTGVYHWSAAAAAPANFTLDVPVNSVVTVTKGGVALANLAVYAFAEDGTYLGQAVTTNAAGQAQFVLATGLRVKFRVSDGGVYHWSTVAGCPANVSVLVPRDTVVTVLKYGQPIAGLTVYAFDANDVYLDYAQVTDANGVARFSLAEGQNVKFRVTDEGVHQWSAVAATPAELALSLPAPTTVTVAKAGAPLVGVTLYAFDAAGNYLGYSRVSDANGQAQFALGIGTQVRFRVTDAGVYHWSETVSAPAPATLAVPADTVVTVTKGGVALGNVTVYAFSDAGVYLDYARNTDADGVARFALAEGSSVAFRVTDTGVYHWSTAVQTPAPARVAVPANTVVTVTKAGAAYPNVTVYAFTAAGQYLNYATATDAAGVARFALAAGSSFQFRVSDSGIYHWSPTVTAPAAVTLAVPADSVLTVTRNGQPVADLTAYAFTEADVYTGYAQTTAADGTAAFAIAAGSRIKFRITDAGQYVWSDVITTPANTAIALGVPPDTTPPTIAGLTPADGSFTNNSAPTLRATVTDAGRGVDPGSLSLVLDGAPLDATFAAGVLAAVPPAELAAGQHAVAVAASDLAGNGTSSVWHFVVDLTPPADLGHTPGDGALLADAQPAITLLVADAGGLDPASVSLTVADTAVTPAVLPAGDDWLVSYTPAAPLAEGVVTVQASFADRAGNPGFAAWAFELDLTPPAAPALYAATSPVAVWRDTALVQFRTSLDTDVLTATSATAAVAVVERSAALDDGWLWSVALSGLTNGDHALAVVARDAAGNAAAPLAVVLHVFLDAEPPTFLTVEPEPEAGTLFDVEQLAMAGTIKNHCLTGLHLNVAWTGTAQGDRSVLADLDLPFAYLDGPDADGYTVWQWTATAPLRRGFTTVLLTATDAAGLVATCTRVYRLNAFGDGETVDGASVASRVALNYFVRDPAEVTDLGVWVTPPGGTEVKVADTNFFVWDTLTSLGGQPVSDGPHTLRFQVTYANGQQETKTATVNGDNAGQVPTLTVSVTGANGPELLPASGTFDFVPGIRQGKVPLAIAVNAKTPGFVFLQTGSGSVFLPAGSGAAQALWRLPTPASIVQIGGRWLAADANGNAYNPTLGLGTVTAMDATGRRSTSVAPTLRARYDDPGFDWEHLNLTAPTDPNRILQPGETLTFAVQANVPTFPNWSLFPDVFVDGYPSGYPDLFAFQAAVSSRIIGWYPHFWSWDTNAQAWVVAKVYPPRTVSTGYALWLAQPYTSSPASAQASGSVIVNCRNVSPAYVHYLTWDNPAGAYGDLMLPTPTATLWRLGETHRVRFRAYSPLNGSDVSPSSWSVGPLTGTGTGGVNITTDVSPATGFTAPGAYPITIQFATGSVLVYNPATGREDLPVPNPCAPATFETGFIIYDHQPTYERPAAAPGTTPYVNERLTFHGNFDTGDAVLSGATHRWTISGPAGTMFADGPWLVTGASADGDPADAADLVFGFGQPGTYTVTHILRYPRQDSNTRIYADQDYSASVSVTIVAPLDADVVVSDLPDDPQHKRLHYTLPGQAERGWARLYTKEAADRPFVTRDLAAPDLTASYHQLDLTDRLQGTVIGEECHGEIQVDLGGYRRAATDETWQFTDDTGTPLPHGSEQLIIQGRNAKNSYTLKYLGATPQAAAGEDPATKPLTIELKADTDGSQAASDSAITPDGIVPDPGAGGAWPQQTVTRTLPEVTAGFSLYVHSGKKWGKMILRTGPGHLVRLDDPAALEPGLKTRWADKQKFADVHVVCDIVADTNRDGIVDDSDEDGKDTFTSARGAVILNNADRDGGQKTPDNADQIINGPKDLPDLSRVVVRPTGMKSFPKGVRAVLRIPGAETNLIRVFLRQNQAAGVLGSSQVLGKDLPGGSATEYVLPEATMTKGAGSSLYAEALQFIGVDGFAGQLKIQHAFQRQMPDGTWPDLCSDEVQLQVAPVVFAWNGQTAEKIYASPKIASVLRTKVNGIPVIRGPGVLLGGGDWLQDYLEFGSCTNGPQCRLRVIVDLDHPDSDGWPLDLAKDDPSFAYVMRNHGGEGGDIEVVPPHGNYPVGRIVMGSSSSVQLPAFVKSQRVQVSPEGSILKVVTSWLDVGHLDEMICFVPTATDRFAVLVASPRAAVDVMHRLFVGGSGQAEIQGAQGTEGEGTRRRTEFTTVAKTLVGMQGTASTHLSRDISADDEWVNLDTDPGFSEGDYLRVGDEYMQVEVPLGDRVKVIRQPFPPGQRLPPTLPCLPAAHPKGSVIYALSDFVRESLVSYQCGGVTYPGAQAMLDAQIQHLRQEVDENLQVVELPVLFVRRYANREGRWQAYTSNVVNGLVAHGQLIMPDTFGPCTTVGGVVTNHFHAEIQTRLNGLLTPVFIDAWALHVLSGEVHCGSNCLRSPLSTDWWKAWPASPGQ